MLNRVNVYIGYGDNYGWHPIYDTKKKAPKKINEVILDLQSNSPKEIRARVVKSACKHYAIDSFCDPFPDTRETVYLFSDLSIGLIRDGIYYLTNNQLK